MTKHIAEAKSSALTIPKWCAIQQRWRFTKQSITNEQLLVVYSSHHKLMTTRSQSLVGPLRHTSVICVRSPTQRTKTSRFICASILAIGHSSVTTVPNVICFYPRISYTSPNIGKPKRLLMSNAKSFCSISYAVLIFYLIHDKYICKKKSMMVLLLRTKNPLRCCQSCWFSISSNLWALNSISRQPHRSFKCRRETNHKTRQTFWG